MAEQQIHTAEGRIAQRCRRIEVSGIRRVFELGARLPDPINLSIGQPDFPVPEAIKRAAIDAVRGDRNGYTLTQGDPTLLGAIAAHLRQSVGWEVPSEASDLMVTSGTSGALLLAFLALLDPGDEAIVADPYFVIYPALAEMSGGRAVLCDTYPDFRMTAARVEPLIGPRTKIVLVNSPANPSGVVLSEAELRDLVDLCAAAGVVLISDEIYDVFTYAEALHQGRCPSPARFGQDLLLVRGFGKTYGCTGWRMGYAAGPRHLVRAMAKLQQYTFVCAPSMAQAGCAAAFGVDMSAQVRQYQRRRDMVAEALGDVTDLVVPGGAFYAFVEIPPRLRLSGGAFSERAVERNVLVIPGSVFSRRDTHVRISYAVPEAKLAAGLAIIRQMLQGR
jgi:aspartate/methionine/tyrosine aminotransferase